MTYADLAGRGARPDGRSWESPADCGPARGRQRHRDRGHLPRGSSRDAIPCCSPARTATRRPRRRYRARHRPGRRRPGLEEYGPARHDLHPDLAAPAQHVGLHRLAEAGAALPRPTSSPTPKHRGVPRHPRQRPGGDHAADALLLRPLGAQQPPAAAAPVILTEARWPMEASGRFAEAGATAFAGVPYTFDLLEPRGFDDRELPVAEGRDPGRRAAGPRTAYGATRPPGSPRGLGPVRDVRADRGHRADGLPAPRPGRRAPVGIGVPIPGGTFRSTATTRSARSSTPAPT